MPCSHGNRTPREIYEECVKARYECSPNDSIVSWFGRTAEEILLALQCYDDVKYMKDQKPMTREEAESIVCKQHLRFNGNYHRPDAASLVNSLEALGLLKFDEVKKEEPEIVRLHVDGRTYEIGSDTYGVKIESIVKALNKAGYRIYKGGSVREL